MTLTLRKAWKELQQIFINSTHKYNDEINNDSTNINLIEDSSQKAWHAIITAYNKTSTEAWVNLDKPLSETEMCIFHNLQKHLPYVPLNRMLGKRFFWKNEFDLSPYTFEPRPETEAIIELSLRFKPKRILDIGTGTGCILLSLLQEHKCYGIGLDSSPMALATAISNAQKLGLEANFGLVKSEEFSLQNITINPTQSQLKQHILTGLSNQTHSINKQIPTNSINNVFNDKFDLIVSNPPYVKTQIDLLNSHIDVDYATKFDPLCAVFHNEPTVILPKDLPLQEGGSILIEVPKYHLPKYADLFKKNYKSHKTSHPEIFIFEYCNQ